MNITALQRPETDVPLERLSGNATLTDREKIGEVSRQFEAVLVRQILAQTQKPVIKTKFTDNSAAAGIYRDLINNQIADSITKSGSIGLAQSLSRQLDKQLLSPPPTPATADDHSFARLVMNEKSAAAEKSAAPDLAFLPTRP